MGHSSSTPLQLKEQQ